MTGAGDHAEALAGLKGGRWLDHAILTPEQMGAADRAAALVLGGSYPLMERAGAALAAVLAERYPRAAFDVLCGPGNNGGDGYAAAAFLRAQGRDATVWALEAPRAGDAQKAAAAFGAGVRGADGFEPREGRVVVDALFGAGLARPLDGLALRLVEALAASDARVVAVDVPSGLDGASGRPLGACARAERTVTFARLKPAHVLQPGRSLCGRIELRDIGIGNGEIAGVGVSAFANGPDLWADALPWPGVDAHKYSRGHLAVCSGGFAQTGAARLCAQAGARAGAGAVTVLSPGSALAANAAHLTAIMLKRVDDADALAAFLADKRVRAVALGPGFGDLRKARDFAQAALSREELACVLDADALTAFREAPEALFAAARGNLRCALTPHEGEFGRVFSDLAARNDLSKIEKARQAAARANAVVVLKGPDTVIAEPSGQAVVNTNATPFLATAGSGDVLAGVAAGLLAQGMPVFEACCAAVWLHAEAGRRLGPGLTADDLPDALRPVLRDLAPDDLTG